ncbi:MAG: hypothetical protein SH850_02920 [Planctomycetaceae bacterium]|nr:hypothetical protein [Planctomycetaceae bacterium]
MFVLLLMTATLVGPSLCCCTLARFAAAASGESSAACCCPVGGEPSGCPGHAPHECPCKKIGKVAAAVDDRILLTAGPSEWVTWLSLAEWVPAGFASVSPHAISEGMVGCDSDNRPSGASLVYALCALRC